MKVEHGVVVVAILSVVGLVLYQKYGAHLKTSDVVSHMSSTKASTPAASAGQKQAVVVVNVLDKKLYDDAHIAGSIHVPYEDLKKEAQKWDKSATIVIYCADYQCGASKEAVVELTALGFTDARAYEGGMAEWYRLHQQDAAYAFEGPAKEKYLTRDVKRPRPGADQHGNVREISAEELKKLLAH